MTSLAAFDAFCGGLKGARFVVQWHGAHVHKVGPKVFAIGGEGYIFKATPMGFALLTEQGLATRAPYLRQGFWVRVTPGALSQAELFHYLAESHRVVAASLTKAARRELGLD